MFNKFKKKFKDEYELDKYLTQSKTSKFKFAIDYLYYTTKAKYDITMCRYFGHKWIDEGSAGPESGYIEMSCNRCGFSHDRVYLY